MENTQQIEQPHSVKININAKGHWSAEIKTYAQTPDQALQQTLKKAKEIEKIIQEKNKI